MALTFYSRGFVFFLLIPSLAASLGGGGPALANQFASAIAAAGGFVVGRGASGAQAPSRAIERGFARGIARMRRSEEHTSELQSLMRISSDAFCSQRHTTAHHTKSRRTTRTQFHNARHDH